MSELLSEGWPKDGSPADFNDLAAPLRRALRFAYSMRRQNRSKDIPWKGPDIGWREQATCLSPIERFRAEYLAESKEDQGRDALDEIIGVAIQLGIEQGRRICRSEPEYQTMKFQIEVSRHALSTSDRSEP